MTGENRRRRAEARQGERQQERDQSARRERRGRIWEETRVTLWAPR